MDGRRLVGGAVEIRAAADGPHLHGVMVTEGRAASGGRAEVFTPGSVEWPRAGVSILAAHRLAPETRAVPVREPDGRITVRTPATPAIREAVEGGRRYMSVEFHAIRERTTRGGVREVLQAYVPAAALVDSPEYDTTAAEVRARRRIRSRMPLGKAVDCRCAGEGCESALVESIDLGGEVLGYAGDYSKPLGAATAKTVKRGGVETVETEIEVATGTSHGADLVALIEAGVTPIVRPYPDPARSESRKEGRVRVYGRLAVAAWIVTWTDQAGGFTPASLAGDAEKRRVVGSLERPASVEAILRPRADSSTPSFRRVWL